MKMKRGNAGVTLLIIILFVVVIAMSAFILWDKSYNTPNNNIVENDNVNNTVSKNEKEDLTAKEIEKIEEFVNKGENNPLAIKTYSNPADLFNNKNSQPTSYYLKYAVQLSNYSKKLTVEQLNELYGDKEPLTSAYGTPLNDVINFLKEKMNYTYSIETIKNNMNINEKLNMFVTMISDTIISPLEITSGYKYDGKIYVETNLKFTITLTEKDGNYYFYASEGLAW